VKAAPILYSHNQFFSAVKVGTVTANRRKKCERSCDMSRTWARGGDGGEADRGWAAVGTRGSAWDSSSAP